MAVILIGLRTAGADDEEEKRALEQENTADVVFLYEGADNIQLYKPRKDGKGHSFKSLKELLTFIDEAKTKKELLVVIIGKPVHAGTPDELKQVVDKLEGDLGTLKFKRLVFQLATATGRPIYRESGK